MEELEIGMYKILEPREELRGLESKQVAVTELDVIMVLADSTKAGPHRDG